MVEIGYGRKREREGEMGWEKKRVRDRVSEREKGEMGKQGS